MAATPQSAARRPNLFLIGAMKSGTTYLTKLLGQHPSIFMVFPWEPSYFVDPDDLRTWFVNQWGRRLWEDEGRYLALFRDAQGEKHLGEGSTNYAKLPMIPGVPEAIHAYDPDAHIVYAMRDPVERTISHYWHNVRYHTEKRPMREAVENDVEYQSVSHYAMQLRPYLDRFGRDRVSLLTFEGLTKDPEPTFRRLFRELGVDETFVPPGVGKSEHTTPKRVVKAHGHGVLRDLQGSSLWKKLRPVVPSPIRHLGARLAGTEVDIGSFDVQDVVEYLRPIQREQTNELTELTGESYPEWTTLYGSDSPDTHGHSGSAVA